jgi:hypothetical protein
MSGSPQGRHVLMHSRTKLKKSLQEQFSAWRQGHYNTFSWIPLSFNLPAQSQTSLFDIQIKHSHAAYDVKIQNIRYFKIIQRLKK